MQAARKGVCAAAFGFVEFAACVQLGEHEFYHGQMLGGVVASGDAAPVVAHGDGLVGVDFYADAGGVAAKGFVGGVVDDFLDDVGGAVGAGVHARAFFDGF